MEIIDMLSRAMELPKGTLTGGEFLSELEAWDSLAVLNFMALVDTHCGIRLSPDEILKLETVSDVGVLVSRSMRPQS
jgi:acyl carrier protein